MRSHGGLARAPGGGAGKEAGLEPEGRRGRGREGGGIIAPCEVGPTVRGVAKADRPRWAWPY